MVNIGHLMSIVNLSGNFEKLACDSSQQRLLWPFLVQTPQKTHLSSDSICSSCFLRSNISNNPFPLYNVEHSPRNHALAGDETLGYGPRADPWLLFKL